MTALEILQNSLKHFECLQKCECGEFHHPVEHSTYHSGSKIYTKKDVDCSKFTKSIFPNKDLVIEITTGGTVMLHNEISVESFNEQGIIELSEKIKKL